MQSVLSSGFQGKRTIKYFGKSHQKFMEVILLWKKNKNIFWFLNNSEHHHQEMGLELVFYVLIKHIHIFDLIFKFKRKQNKTYIYIVKGMKMFSQLCNIITGP